MANNATLNFVVKMQNQAQAALNSLGKGFQQLGVQAGGAGRNVNSLAIQLTGLNQSAQLAQMGLRGIGQVVGSNLNAFQKYDLAMNRIQRVTNESTSGMASFSSAFNNMTMELRAVDVGRLQEVAVQAAQLGIVGEADILKFTSTIGKLETSLVGLGDEAPKMIARVLAATGQGVDGVERFASVLVRMAKDASASEQVILEMTAQLGQSTAQFDVSAAALLGLSTAASNLNFKPELFGTAMQRTFQQLQEGATQSTEGMRSLTAITGLSAEEFNNLIETSPDQAFLLFLDVLKQLNAEGLSTATFLEQFNLNASENVRVLGAAAQNVDEFRKNVERANEEQLNPVSLDQEFSTALEAYATATTEAGNAWTLFQTAVGEGLAPIATTVLKGITDALGAVTRWLRGLPDMWRTSATAAGVFLASMVTLAPVIVGVVGILKTLGGLVGLTMLKTAAGWVISLAVGFGRLIGTIAGLARLGPILSFLAGAIGAVVTAIGIVPVLIATAIAAAIALGIAIYQNWDKVVEFLSQPIGDILAQTFNASVDAAVSGFWNILNGIKGAWDSFWGSPEMNVPSPNMADDKSSVMSPAAQEANRQAFIERNSGVVNSPSQSQSRISLDNQKIIEELDTQTDQLKVIKDQENALKRLREVGASDPYRILMGITDEDVARMETLVGFARVEADAVSRKMQALQEEAVMASARTAAQRNEAEIQAAILEIIKERGQILAEDEQMLRDQLGYLQQIRAVTALTNEMVSASNRLQTAQAITRQQQNQVALQQQQNGLVDEYGNQLGEIAAIMETIGQAMQTEQFNALEERLDPIGAATRAFADDQYTLNAALAAGTIEMDRYNFLMGALARSTEDARNPYASLIRSMREEIDILGITGPYRTADQAALKQVNQLKQQGVMVTAEMAVAMQNLYRATEDYRASVEDGFAGWAANIKDTKGQILELQEAFAEGASGLLSDVLSGEEDALLSFIDNMKKKLLDAFSDAVMKNLLGNLGNNMGGLLDTTFGKPKDGAEAALAQLSNMTAMNVTAAAVYINGSAMGAAGSGLLSGGMQPPVAANNNEGWTTPWSPSNDNGQQQRVPGGNVSAVPTRMDPIGTFPELGQWPAGRTVGTIPTVGPNAGTYMPSGGGGAGIGTEISTAIQPLVQGIEYNTQTLDQMLQQTMDSLGVPRGGDKSSAMDSTLEGTFSSLNSTQLTSEMAALQMQLDATAEKTRSTAGSFQQAGQQIQQAGQQATSAVPAMGGLGANINTVGQNSVSAGQGLGGLGGILGQLFSGLQGGGGGGGGFGGIFSSVLGMLFHDGGKVGTTSKGRMVNPAMFMGAPRFHEGLGNDEYPAILQRGERVLTAQQNSRTENVIAGLAANQNGQGNNITIGDINVTTQSTGDAAKDEQNGKMTAKAIDQMLEKKMAKWATNQRRPGGIISQGSR